MKTHKILSLLLGLVIIFSLAAAPVIAQDDGSTERPAGWDEDSHGETTDPEYAIVFPQEEVNTITLTVTPENWQAMQDNMTDLYGEFGSRGGSGLPGAGFPEPGVLPGGAPPAGAAPPAGMGGMPPGMQAGVGGPVMVGTSENPDWISVDIKFEGQTWTNVGFRLKGNSTLSSTWGSGNWKLPFKLDFDQFEDEYPEIENQRFYGFKQLSFSSNWSDASLLREKVAADIFREAGIPAAQTAFYAVYVDYGEGPIYFGLYTAVEVVDDTVIETQFDDDSGNVYKPEGTAATFAADGFDAAAFDKETNQDEADYSDILALFDALHANTRTTDPETWRSTLESVFDVDEFIHWLAVNTVIQNWDTYGQMAHNYYLYTDPTTGLITWIPWDNNMALMAGMGAGRGELSLDLDNVSSSWPLIRYLMDDPVYHALYVTYVEETITNAFEPAKMTATYQTLYDLIAPYVVGGGGEQPGHTNLTSSEEFASALAGLIDHVNQRYAAAQDYLSSQTAAQ